MKRNDGKYFENKTAQIVKQFNPDKEVKPNVKIRGKLSNKLRQIDVLIEPSQFDYLIFECKDHTRPIDLDTFGIFTSLIEDTGYKKAAMVSNTPYTDGVQNIAKSKGIDLLHIIDTNDQNIRTSLEASVLLKDTKLINFQMSFSTTANFPGIYYDPIINGEHFTGKGRDYIQYLWNETELLQEVTGDHTINLQNAYIIDVEGNSAPFDVSFNYGVEDEYYLGGVEVQNTQGIFNVAKNSYQTKSLETAKIEPYEVEKVWRKITKEEAHQQQVSLGLSVKSLFER